MSGRSVINKVCMQTLRIANSTASLPPITALSGTRSQHCFFNPNIRAIRCVSKAKGHFAHATCLETNSICKQDSYPIHTNPVIEILFPRLLPAEPAILSGPQRRIILIGSLDVLTSPSWFLRDAWLIGSLGIFARNLGRGLPAIWVISLAT